MRRKKSIMKQLDLYQIRDLDAWDMNYMLQLTGHLIRDEGPGNENLRICRQFIRKCTGAAVKQKDVVKNLVNIVPTYGPAIAAGFTLVLTALEEHESLRNSIHAALADIPKKLNAVQRLSEVHVESLKLHACKDQVLLRIIMVLHSILDRLSRSNKDKVLSKFGSDAPDIPKTLKNMDEAVAEYLSEADICAQIRMGRIEEGNIRLNNKVDILERRLDGYTNDTISSIGRVEKAIEEFLPLSSMGKIEKTIEEVLQRGQHNHPNEKQMEITLYNVLYRLFASCPQFSAIDGTVNKENIGTIFSGRFEPSLSYEKEAVFTPPPPYFLLSENKRQVDAWMAAFPNYDPASDAQVVDNLSQMGGFDIDEQDQMQYLLNDPSLGSWLGSVQSSTLEITAETAPDNLINPISATSAMLVLLMKSSSTAHCRWAVMSFFCGSRRLTTNPSSLECPIDILHCLIGQLVHFILEENLDVNLASVLTKREFRPSRVREKPGRAMRLLEEILILLPERQVVILILDSLSRLSGNTHEVEKIIKRLNDTARKQTHLIIKLLVTDPLPNCQIDELANMTVHLPDHVDGWQCGVRRDVVEKETRAAIERFRQNRERSEKKLSEGEDEDNSDDEWSETSYGDL
ncbi:hypothetical protein N7462_005296 [Penicillium macrosclerotiorum]|uniref:uncharacterized protein n=1 Tax=Penicillium macrosclerotiorum TaxID=303699 RepID=UPI002547BACC|nr:uncharacterized protein N7462_005296 [Penicillium macrosclerotiorum]KAJ5690904.1 hypothetical protein N7462_005296 [Penicillium macrosclerotiorum]